MTAMISARSLTQRLVEDLEQRYLTGMERMDNWRRALSTSHGQALSDAFTQVLEMARKLA